jgi:hypothetical protein
MLTKAGFSPAFCFWAMRQALSWQAYKKAKERASG